VARRALIISGTEHDRRLAALACPDCYGGLESALEEITCARCQRKYPMIDGTPVLLPSGDGDDYKHAQAAFFDSEPREFELTRPHGQPALYRWLLAEKFRISVAPVLDRLVGRVAVAVCGGSGMDAENLSAVGAHVISIDISVGAALRTRERARRYGFDVLTIVGDAERLPVVTQGVSLAYVHDGLHHLRDPYSAVSEMARIADYAVSINEPSAALVTRLAVAAGIAERQESAGNQVARLDIRRVSAELEQRGFTVAAALRYAMFYRHYPGPAVRFLSRPRTIGLACSAVRRFNAHLGSVGNKLSIVGLREG
jgi:uncharacterized protein YbaR (Trm112 family)